MPSTGPDDVPTGQARATAPASGLQVVAAAIFDAQGRVLIARRPVHVHQGGLWEFPGGKVETGESARMALARELHEEIGIEVRSARPLIRIFHDYGDRAVRLDVWRVDAYGGTPHGREGQPVAWVRPDDLVDYPIPVANRPIVTAVRLPESYLITPAVQCDATFLADCDRALGRGIRLLQFRDHDLSPDRYRMLAAQLLQRCRVHGARLLLNNEPALARELGADGVHLTSSRLLQLGARPLPANYWVAASCHNEMELHHAEEIGVDFVVASPVLATPSHPEASPLGWLRFGEWCARTTVPVYALGGMNCADLPQVFELGGQGIAAIRGLWEAA